MATVTESIQQPEKVNVLKLKKTDQSAVGVCTEAKYRKPGSVAPRGLERPATAQLTCCPPYPPGSTLLECRFEGDQPIAHVVQVPADGNTATQKMSLLVETKQSASGPYSRVLSRPVEYPQDPGQIKSTQNEGCNGPPRLQMAYRLESRECDGGPMAMITKVPTDETPNSVMTLEITKGEGQPDGPTSRIHYGPVFGESLEASSCAENSRNLPATMIECCSSAKRTSARMTRCMRDIARRAKTASASGSRRSVRAPSTSCLDHRITETRVDEHGPRVYVTNLPQDIDGSSKKAKSIGDDRCPETQHQQPKRRRSETTRADCSPPKCLTICPASNKGPRPTERRNGLDSEDNLPVSLFRRIPRKEVCPCAPSTDRPVSCTSEHGQRARGGSSCPKSYECPERRGESDRTYKDCTEPKSKTKIHEVRKVPEDCTKPKYPKEDGCREKRKSVEDCSKSFVPEIPSQELLTRFRDYFPPHQLQRYEVCRSRRNGLQDQCPLAIPRKVIELKKKEMSLARDFREKPDGAVLTQPSRHTVKENSPNKPVKAKAVKSEEKPQKSSKLQRKKKSTKPVKSRELFRGAVYIDCDCYHRNGLQHDCPRSSCGGRSCRVKPWPECELGTYFMNKWDKYYQHLDTIPPTSFCGPIKAWLEFLAQQEKKLRKQCQEQEADEEEERKSTRSRLRN